jgi:hypothetical protein
VQRDGDEDAWRTIVENYGERIDLDDEPPSGPAVDPDEKEGYDAAGSPGLQRLFRPLPEPQPELRPEADYLEDDDDFVPPTPPPLPRVPPDRLLAWVGLFGSPSLLLICLVLNVRLAPWLGYLLVLSFIGGFIYLVVNMPRGEDVDPWDDGARL